MLLSNLGRMKHENCPHCQFGGDRFAAGFHFLSFARPPNRLPCLGGTSSRSKRSPAAATSRVPNWPLPRGLLPRAMPTAAPMRRTSTSGRSEISKTEVWPTRGKNAPGFTIPFFGEYCLFWKRNRATRPMAVIRNDRGVAACRSMLAGTHRQVGSRRALFHLRTSRRSSDRPLRRCSPRPTCDWIESSQMPPRHPDRYQSQEEEIRLGGSPAGSAHG